MNFVFNQREPQMIATARRPLTKYSAIPLLLLCLSLCTATVGHCAAESKALTAPRKLVAAIVADLPPTYFLDHSGKPDGFAVDVMNEIARLTGLSVEYVSGKSFDDVIQMVLTGKADLIPSLTIDERRKELLAFTDTIGFLQANLFVASGNLTIQGISPSLTIGVVKGSVPESFLMKNKTIRLITFDNAQTMLFELLAGHVDGIVFLTPNLMKLAIDAGVEDKIKVVGKPIIEAKRGIALRKEDTELLTRLNKAIEEFVGTPEYRQIYTKWYGKPKPYWTAGRIGAVSGILLTLILCGMAFWRYRSVVRLNNRLNLSIAKNKQAEDAVLESERKYRSLASTADSMYLVDRDCCFLLVNERHLARFGLPEEQVIGRKHGEFHSAEGAVIFENYIKQVFETGESFQDEYCSAKDNRYFIRTFSPVKDDNGMTSSVTVVAKDITDRKLAEEALQTNEERYRDLVENAKDFVYRMDGAGHFTYVNPSGLRVTGYKEEELIGENYSTLIRPDMRDDAIKFFGRQFVKGIKSTYSEYPILTKEGNEIWLGQNTELIFEDGQVIGFQAVSRDITERKQAEKKLEDTLESLRKAVGTTIHVLASTVETRDPYTAGHQTRSADLARAIGTEMGLPQEKIDAIRIAGSIHDIGKLSIPAEILSKPTRLSEIEFSLIKEHSRKGFEMLKDVESPWPLAEIVHQHHERMDGSGYPRNLKGEEICIEARILAVADVMEAMASHRPYRPGLGIDAALNEIEKNRRVFYDDAVADACLRLFREKGFKLAGA
jgi:PAS domain S-box-containing protein